MPTVGSSGPIRAAQLVKCLGVGGTERQFVALLRELDPAAVSPRVGCLIKWGEYLPDLATLGIAPVEFGLRGSLLKARTLVEAVQMAQWLRRERAQLLHCHDFYSNVIGSMAARLAGIPYVVSRRDIGSWLGPARQRLLALVTRGAPMVLCNADAVREAVLREGVAPSRVRVVHNGIDLAAFDREMERMPEPPLPRLAGGPVVTLVANMKHELKGHSEFLVAAAIVRARVRDARFLLVGDGTLRPDLERRAQEMGLGDSVFFARARTDVPALLARSTVAVSASSSEGLSNAVLEGMAARLPVVATRVGGTSELVVDGRTGFLIDPHRPQDLAASILNLLQHPTLAKKLGAAARWRIEEEFQVRALAERTTELYAEITGRPQAMGRAA